MAGRVRYPLKEYAPELAAEYSPSNTVPIDKVGRGSVFQAIWICQKCKKEFPYPKSPAKRYFLYAKHNRVGDCPNCGDLSNKILSDSYNFAVCFPDHARNWDYQRNKTKPEDHLPYETSSFFFKCFDNPLHTWCEQLCQRSKSKLPCPICGGKRPGDGHCLADLYPHIAREWSSLNELHPFEVNPHSGIEFWWKCQNPEHPPYRMTVCNKVRYGVGCEKCKPSLETEYPDLAKEWNYELNEGLLPSQVTSRSGLCVWWNCLNPDCGEPYEAYIYNRVLRQDGCIHCSKKASRGERDIKGVLDSNKVCYKRQCKADGLLGSGGRSLRFDFGVLDGLGFPVAFIEYHGHQHYEVVNWCGDIEVASAKLNYTQGHDFLKKEYCLKRGVPLLIISYSR